MSTTTETGGERPAGRHALITGGSSGIGLAAAERLLRTGERVTIVGRDRERLAAARTRLAACVASDSRSRAGGERTGAPGDPASFTGRASRADSATPAVITPAAVLAVTADVGDLDALAAAVAEAEAAHGPVTRLIASAGVSMPGRFENLPMDEFRRQMDINYLGTVHIVHAVLPGMRRAGRGRIALMSSGAGLIGLFGYTAYSATKFAVRGFGEALAAELDGSGVTVSICYPPDTDTPMHQAELAGGRKPIETQAMTGSGGLMSAAEVARALIAGMDRGELHITPGLEMSLLQRFGGIGDPLIRRYLAGIARRARSRAPRDG
jgi:3-dehydrosphinganine reductase